jgi:cysteinyl-tRNA synthetase
MSKSKGEFLRLQTLVDGGISPLAYRYYLLTTHYRSEIAFSLEALRGAASAYEKLVSFAREHKTDAGVVHEGYKAHFLQALSDDLSTPQAIAVLWNMIKDDSLSYDNRYKTLLSFDESLGLALSLVAKEQVVITEELQLLLNERKAAKENKDWIKADELRNKINELGYIVKDTKEGQELNKK